jgi:hypothetical protein
MVAKKTKDWGRTKSCPDSDRYCVDLDDIDKYAPFSVSLRIVAGYRTVKETKG